MKRLHASSASFLVTVYILLMVAFCVALQFDSSGAVQSVMNAHLFFVPFFKKPIDVTFWKLFGSFGALLFAGRWVVQFIYARRAGRPVTPLIFWVMSLIGSNLTLIYFIYSPKQDMVGVIGNFLPTFVAAYNLYLEIRLRAKEDADRGISMRAETKIEKDPPVVPLVAVREEPAAGE